MPVSRGHGTRQPRQIVQMLLEFSQTNRGMTRVLIGEALERRESRYDRPVYDPPSRYSEPPRRREPTPQPEPVSSFSWSGGSTSDGDSFGSSGGSTSDSDDSSSSSSNVGSDDD